VGCRRLKHEREPEEDGVVNADSERNHAVSGVKRLSRPGAAAGQWREMGSGGYEL